VRFNGNKRIAPQLIVMRRVINNYLHAPMKIVQLVHVRL